MEETEETKTLEQVQARHRKEAKELQGRITNKKKNATKKTRKGINDECAALERAMKERQAEEVGRFLQPQQQGEAEKTKTRQEEEEEGGELNGKMEKMEIATPPTTTTTTTPTPSSNDNDIDGANPTTGAKPSQKRNRQKERLARRAAEQEAAAAAAAEEAAHMPDHRARETTALRAAFGRHGLVEHEIRPDGHCLFAAVADQLALVGVPLLGEGKTQTDKEGEGEGEAGGKNKSGGGEVYKIVRRRAAEYIQAHGDEYAGFLDEDLGAYVRKIRDTAEWGGQVELSALANVYGVEIGVVQDQGTEVIGPSSSEGNRKKIWLAYYRHGYGLGEHYNSLRKTGE